MSDRADCTFGDLPTDMVRVILKFAEQFAGIYFVCHQWDAIIEKNLQPEAGALALVEAGAGAAAFLYERHVEAALRIALAVGDWHPYMRVLATRGRHSFNVRAPPWHAENKDSGYFIEGPERHRRRPAVLARLEAADDNAGLVGCGNPLVHDVHNRLLLGCRVLSAAPVDQAFLDMAQPFESAPLELGGVGDPRASELYIEIPSFPLEMLHEGDYSSRLASGPLEFEPQFESPHPAPKAGTSADELLAICGEVIAWVPGGVPIDASFEWYWAARETLATSRAAHGSIAVEPVGVACDDNDLHEILKSFLVSGYLDDDDFPDPVLVRGRGRPDAKVE